MGFVHHLQARRDDARGDRRPQRRRLCRTSSKLAMMRQMGRAGTQLDRHFGGHGQHALAADHGGQQVGTGGVEGFAAEGHRLALAVEALDLSTLCTVSRISGGARRPVLGHVAADGAGDLAAGVRVREYRP